MNNLKEIINPTIGILTNIGTAHDEYFMDVNKNRKNSICFVMLKLLFMALTMELLRKS